MNVEYINPFLGAVINVLKTMASIETTTGKPYRKGPDDPLQGDVSGVVGLTGPVNGSFTMSFSEAAILEVVSSMFGETMAELNREVEDAVGELSNMVSGDARRALEEKGSSFQAAIPTVISGPKHSITPLVNGPVIVMPFATASGHAFHVEISFEG